jgi:cytochrome P450
VTATPEAPADAGALEYDPYDAETVHNPFPVYRRLRDEAPVYFNEEHGFWALSRYDDVVEAHLDHETFTSTHGVTIEGLERFMPLLIVKDPPDHTAHRRVVSTLFTPRRIGQLESFVRQTAVDLLDRLQGRDTFDVVQEFAIRLPLDVISELIGVPVELRAEVHRLSDIAAARNGREPLTKEEIQASMGLQELLTELARERRRNPGDDVITTLMQTPVEDEDGGRRYLDDDEIGVRFLELAFAGHETVAKLIPNAVVALAWHPEQRARLDADPSQLPKAVEEMLRWDPPSHYQGRWTTRDVTLHGVTIPAGQRVILLTGAALHDPRQFADPETFDMDRLLERHVAFGLGRHVCLGASLARLETRIAFEELLQRYPEWDLVEGGAQRRMNGNVRGLRNLRIAVKPSSVAVG